MYEVFVAGHLKQLTINELNVKIELNVNTLFLHYKTIQYAMKNVAL